MRGPCYYLLQTDKVSILCMSHVSSNAVHEICSKYPLVQSVYSVLPFAVMKLNILAPSLEMWDSQDSLSTCIVVSKLKILADISSHKLSSSEHRRWAQKFLGFSHSCIMVASGNSRISECLWVVLCQSHEEFILRGKVFAMHWGNGWWNGLWISCNNYAYSKITPL